VIQESARCVTSGMFTATHSITIARDAQDVFDYVADAGLQRSWNELVRSMDPVADGPLAVGAHWRGDIARVGRVDVELVEYDRPRRAKHIARPWMAEAHHVWEVREADGGCRRVQHGDVRPRGAGWLMAPLMPLIVRRNPRDCAVSLKRALEG
jgi:Polyketide cyclase / dehydrase and lipid transport